MNELRTSILTISDRSARGERLDESGPALEAAAREQGWRIVHLLVIPDDYETIREQLKSWADTGAMDIILTTGGTGFSPRDVTPEATMSIVERSAPGMAEAMRSASLEKTPHAMLSRAVVGIRGRTLIVNLPGSPRAAVENLSTIIPVLQHAVELLHEAPTAESGHQKAAN